MIAQTVLGICYTFFIRCNTFPKLFETYLYLTMTHENSVLPTITPQFKGQPSRCCVTSFVLFNLLNRFK